MDTPSPGNNFPAPAHAAWFRPVHSSHVQPTFDHSLSWTTGAATGEGAPIPGLAVHAAHNIAAYVHLLPSPYPVPNYPALQSQELPVYSGSNDTSIARQQSMAPPALNPRKRKAPTLHADDWIPVKARIVELHLDENMPLPEVKGKIEQEFPFRATCVSILCFSVVIDNADSRRLRQYRSAVTNWGFDKNIKKNVMQAIVRKRQQRRLVQTNKQDLNFKVHNITVKSDKVDTWMRRNNVPDDTIYAPSPTARMSSTPITYLMFQPFLIVHSHARRTNCLDAFRTSLFAFGCCLLVAYPDKHSNG